MKVLQINSVCGIRGTGRICTDIADILTSDGHECKIAYGRESVPAEFDKYAIKIGNDLSVKFDALKSRVFDNAGFNSSFATRKFIKWAESFNPDVIHIHNIHGYYINIKMLFDYLRRSNKPIVWTLHDCWPFTGHCAYFDFVGCEKWLNGCHRCPQKKEYPTSFLFDSSKVNYFKKKSIFTGIKNLTIVTPSRWLASCVKNSFLKEYPVEVLNNGIDLDVFKPTNSDFRQKHKLENKKIVLGVASVWDRRKGLSDFIKLSKLLNDDYQMVLVGLNKEQLILLPKNVIGLPRILEADELAKIYSAADVFLNLSVEETMGLATVEALACGTPVIVYDRTAVPEVVDEKTGIVVKAGDIDSLLDAVGSIRAETDDCTKYAAAFDKQNKYKGIIDIYINSIQ